MYVIREVKVRSSDEFEYCLFSAVKCQESNSKMIDLFDWDDQESLCKMYASSGCEILSVIGNVCNFERLYQALTNDQHPLHPNCRETPQNESTKFEA